jgi:hypothetical protein
MIKKIIVANHDNREYYRMTNAWLAHLAVLQGALYPDLMMDDPLVASWQGCDFEVVESDNPDQTAVILLDSILGLQEVKSLYWKVTHDYKDIGRKLGTMITRYPGLMEFCFHQHANTTNLSWFKVRDAERLLYGIQAAMGIVYFRHLKGWLTDQPTLSAVVKDVLERSGDYAQLSKFRNDPMQSTGTDAGMVNPSQGGTLHVKPRLPS